MKYRMLSIPSTSPFENNSFLLPKSKKLPSSVQVLVNWFAFFLAFPVVDIFGLSLTFFIFIAILFQLNNCKIMPIKSFNGSKIFLLFLATALTSTIFHPPLYTEIPIFVTLINSIQISYWIFVSLFIISNYYLIDWYLFSKYVFWGLLSMIISFYFIPLKLNLIFATINFEQSRNGFVFNTLSFFPIVFLYIANSPIKKYVGMIILLFLAALLFSNGRSGFVLILLQIVLVASVIYPNSKSFFRFLFLGLLSVIIVWTTLENSSIIANIARSIENINPRAASLLAKEGVDGDLTMDKSWLLRKLMVDKSIEINKKYPLLGIGWFNFTNYSSELKSLETYERLGSESVSYYNTRSAHNSYAQLLGEGGYVGLGLFILLMIPILKIIIKKVYQFSFSIFDLPLISVLTLLIYFYAISSLTGTGTWVSIGIAYASAQKSKNIK